MEQLNLDQNLPCVLKAKYSTFNSSHPSADCSGHLNLPSLFPVLTIVVTKYKGLLCNIFALGIAEEFYILHSGV